MASVKFVWHGQRRSLEIKRAAQKGIDKGLKLVKKEIDRLMRMPKSGIKYPNLRNRSSAPGEPPARQTGRRFQPSLRTGSHIKSGRVIGTIGTRTNLGNWLEKGNRKMLPRPVIGVALENKREEIMNVIAEEIRYVTR